jgi:GNAT superfamily N-acetyltransferase
MEIKNLGLTNIESIFRCFCKVFLNYLVPVSTNYEETSVRWKNAGVDLSISYGAFQEKDLVAFVLNSKNKNTIHHFVLGVTPEFRGQGLISKILTQIPFENKIFRLEVISENHKALRLYEKLGYQITRSLECFEGILTLPNLKSSWNYDVLPFQGDRFLPLRLYRPSFEMTNIPLVSPILCETHVLKDREETLAYAHFLPSSLLLLEVGSKGINELDCLFMKMKLHQQKIYLMNIDLSAEFFRDYLLKRGLKNSVRQFEMQRGTTPKTI